MFCAQQCGAASRLSTQGSGLLPATQQDRDATTSRLFRMAAPHLPCGIRFRLVPAVPHDDLGGQANCSSLRAVHCIRGAPAARCCTCWRLLWSMASWCSTGLSKAAAYHGRWPSWQVSCQTCSCAAAVQHSIASDKTKHNRLSLEAFLLRQIQPAARHQPGQPWAGADTKGQLSPSRAMICAPSGSG